MASSKFHYADDKTERRIMLIGPDGSGKSATGNTIFGGEYFQSRASFKSITKKCFCGTAIRFGKKLRVVDTPAIYDKRISNEESVKQISECLRLSSPGPHVFVLVISLGRFTQEQHETVQYFREIFGEEMYNHTIVLFTRWDDIERQNIGIHEYLMKEATEELVSLVHKCNGQVLAINNKQKRKKDAEKIIRLVDQVTKKNRGRYYSNEMCREAEKQISQNVEVKCQKETEVEKQRREIKGEILIYLLEKIENVEKRVREIETKMHKHPFEDRNLGEKRFRDLTMKIELEIEKMNMKLNEMKKMIEDTTEQSRREWATALEKKLNKLVLKYKAIKVMIDEEKKKNENKDAIDQVCDGVKDTLKGATKGYKAITEYWYGSEKEKAKEK